MIVAKQIRIWCVCIAVIVTVHTGAGQVTVRHAEGLVHGFLVVRTTDGQAIAHGDLIQGARRTNVTSRVIFHFKDGSLHDETVVYSQYRSFRLLRYKLVQKGPSFPHPFVLSFDMSSAQVKVQYTGDDGKEQVKAEHMTLPPDLANGMIFTLMKNVASDQTDIKGSMLVATPKPRLVKLSISPQGEDSILLGPEKRTARHYVVKLELGGLTGVVAKVIGKEPPEIHGWILSGEAPAFLRSQGPLYAGGPIWTVELESPVWPRQEDKK
jgi:hypothetical protein